ncbi:sorcin-like protein [Tanacetum coccineum]
MAGAKMEEVLKEWFDRVDSDKTGSITSFQLQRALGVGNLQFPISIVQQMIRMYDFDKNGTMSFEGLLVNGCSLLELIALVSLKHEMYDDEVQQAFSDLERGRGFLVPDEVYEALLKLDISLDSPAFYTVCESFDKEKKGKFRLDDLISLCIFVQSSRAGSLLILINLSTALQIVEYEAFIDIPAEE